MRRGSRPHPTFAPTSFSTGILVPGFQLSQWWGLGWGVQRTWLLWSSSSHDACLHPTEAHLSFSSLTLCSTHRSDLYLLTLANASVHVTWPCFLGACGEQRAHGGGRQPGSREKYERVGVPNRHSPCGPLPSIRFHAVKNDTSLKHIGLWRTLKI